MQKKRKKKIYHIITTSRGKQLRDIYQTSSEYDVNTKFGEFLESNKEVIFPVKYINIGKMVPAEYEYVIIKEKVGNEPTETKVKDENGEFVYMSTSHDNWLVYDKGPMLMEETFWVYGYHPRLQRKTFEWIFKELVEKSVDDKREFRSVLVFQNKLIIDKTDRLDIVMCKNKEDAVRMYNLIESWCAERKYKYVMFGGDVFHSKLRKAWYNRLEEWTSWSWRKLSRNSLRP